MLSGGDELGHTQKGNNNAYCQDNEISWYNWDLTEEDKKFLQFVKDILAIRKTRLVIQRKEYFKGSLNNGHKEILWLAPDGEVMEQSDWDDSEKRTLGLLLDGSGIEQTDAQGHHEIASTILILSNFSHLPTHFVLPHIEPGKEWQLLVTTDSEKLNPSWPPKEEFPLGARSIALLELKQEPLPE